LNCRFIRVILWCQACISAVGARRAVPS
jgi:hypothetical protein